jgi:hypothetical protein
VDRAWFRGGPGVDKELEIDVTGYQIYGRSRV